MFKKLIGLSILYTTPPCPPKLVKLQLFKWQVNDPDRNYWAEIIRKEEEQRKEEITQEQQEL